MRTVDIEKPFFCADIHEASKRLASAASTYNEEVRMFFNDTEVRAKPGMSARDIYHCWLATMRHKRKAYQRSPEYKADMKERQELERKRRALHRDGMKPFSVRDEAQWAKYVSANASDDNATGDDLGDMLLRYVARFAHLAEAKIANGEHLEDFAPTLIYEADSEEVLSGWAYGKAAQVIGEVWEHGEAFRRWHNVYHQVRGEGDHANDMGGTLNPALVGVGGLVRQISSEEDLGDRENDSPEQLAPGPEDSIN